MNAVAVQSRPFIKVNFGFIVKHNLEQVRAIEHASFDRPLTEAEIRALLAQRNCLGMTATHGGRVVGFWLYTLENDEIRLMDLAVHPGFRNLGVGRQMITKLAGKLCGSTRLRIVALARESNLTAHLFLRGCGFRATSVVRGHYRDSREDAYRFEYQL